MQKPSVRQSKHLHGNPYSAPQESSIGNTTKQLSLSRSTSAFLCLLVGVPVGGVSAFLLFSFCYGIGSRVISDATYARYESSIFIYGAYVAVLPSLLCGLLNSRRPIVVLLSSHFIGVALGAVVVESSFHWHYAMGAYFVIASLLPVLTHAIRRPIAFFHEGPSGTH